MPKTTALIALPILLASSASALVLPPEDITLTQLHVQFEWPGVVGATGYDLWVVEDDGSPDPFNGTPAVVDLSVGVSEPRAVASSGLGFGTEYAWRARGVDGGGPLAWGPTYRFDIAALPSVFPTFFTTSFGGPVQPGLTLINLLDKFNEGLSYAVAIDQQGDVFWYVARNSRLSDLRLLDNGRLLASSGGGVEFLLNGRVAWRSPDEFPVHHEVSPMPNGNVLVLLSDDRNVTLNSVTKLWGGDRIVEFDRSDNSIVWDWNTFDHVSTLDYDVSTYESSGGTFDWTHGNAVIYNSADDSVYVSLRAISRIVRIDYATGQTVYNLGFDMPSGDTDFGDNLFSWQHSPEMQPNGNMLVYDNGNRRDHIVQTVATGVTKAVELAFTGDPPTSASIVWEWTLPTYNRTRGDADRLANGNTLVVAANHLEVHEVDDFGTEVWRVTIVLGSQRFTIFRAERIDSLIVDVPGDSDLDGIADFVDNCPDHPNVDQTDSNGDDFGDTCAAALGFPVPEPASDFVLAAGCVTLAMLGRLRRARSTS